jgi:D-glycero-alpha-D-manno-heptose 1-phosphate guanylyltransferase
MECIILAGGQGTRLREVVSDTPKCLAPIGECTFLFYLINMLKEQGVNRFVFSLGYMHEKILTYLELNYPFLDYDFVIEPTPLDTGGAIKFALTKCISESVLIINSDTYLGINLKMFLDFHVKNNAECTFSLKHLHDSTRYGNISINDKNQVLTFNEKVVGSSGFINAGYIFINSKLFNDITTTKFSFEKDFISKKLSSNKVYGFIANDYFIDIGIPKDYFKFIDDVNLSIIS